MSFFLNEDEFVAKNPSEYIRERSLEWAAARRENRVALGLIEKDKVVMASCIRASGIPHPEILFASYHDGFSEHKLLELCRARPKDERLVIKVTHLQRQFGVLFLPPCGKITERRAKEIYARVKRCYGYSLMCDGKGRSEEHPSRVRKKAKTHPRTALYSMIEPGVSIHRRFDGENRGALPFGLSIFVEMGKAIHSKRNFFTPFSESRLEKLYTAAETFARSVGVYFVRVDFFIKPEELRGDLPLSPVLNEFSLSPAQSSAFPRKWRDEELPPRRIFPKIRTLCLNAQKRTLPVRRIVSSADRSRKLRFPYGYSGKKRR